MCMRTYVSLTAIRYLLVFCDCMLLKTTCCWKVSNPWFWYQVHVFRETQTSPILLSGWNSELQPNSNHSTSSLCIDGTAQVCLINNALRNLLWTCTIHLCDLIRNFIFTLWPFFSTSVFASRSFFWSRSVKLLLFPSSHWLSFKIVLRLDAFLFCFLNV